MTSGQSYIVYLPHGHAIVFTLSLTITGTECLGISFSLHRFWQWMTFTDSVCLRHFGFPEHFIRLIHSYYDHLSVIVDIPGLFTTRSFHFAPGVFQGRTLSPIIIFNIIIQLALDVLEKHQSFCYTFSCDQETSLLSLAYADDIQLVTSFPGQNQRLLDTSFLGVPSLDPTLWKPVQTSAGRWR